MKKHLTYLLLLSLSTSLIACGEFDEEQELSEEEILLEASVLDLNDITSQEFALNGNTQQGAFCSLERLRNQARRASHPATKSAPRVSLSS